MGFILPLGSLQSGGGPGCESHNPARRKTAVQSRRAGQEGHRLEARAEGEGTGWAEGREGWTRGMLVRGQQVPSSEAGESTVSPALK